MPEQTDILYGLQPVGPVPSTRQLAWHVLEYYGFLHFTVNTFTDREWGLGNELPELFHPTEFSAELIVETASQAGMKGLILTAKHHDGFCLWPSRFTDHSVKNSHWRGGRGDVVREIADACVEAGLKFGFYLSPWDRHHPEYARPGYLRYFRDQLRELLTQYGPIFEVWFDGASGGDGYYGGQYERREIDGKTYYEWESIFQLVRELQPEACIFGGAGADLRWVGNEEGYAGDSCWHTFSPSEIDDKNREVLNSGVRGGSIWYPAEVDVSIRPGWFYHSSENERVRSPKNLLELYFASVGRGGNLLLNLPPTPAGQIHQHDRASLFAFRELRNQIFSTNLARQAKASISASSTHGGQPELAPSNLMDDRLDTFWCSDESDPSPTISLSFEQPVTFNVVGMREFLPLGQRVGSFSIDAMTGNGWKEVYRGEAIGSRRLVHFADTTSAALRLRIEQSLAAPVLTELTVHYASHPGCASLQEWFTEETASA